MLFGLAVFFGLILCMEPWTSNFDRIRRASCIKICNDRYGSS